MKPLALIYMKMFDVTDINSNFPKVTNVDLLKQEKTDTSANRTFYFPWLTGRIR